MTTFIVQPYTLTNLKGKSVLVTGGGSGIGLAAAKIFLTAGSKVAILDRNEPLEKIDALFLKCDILSWTSQRAAFKKMYDTFGSVDIVYVNAGITENDDMFFTDELDSDGELKEPNHKVLDIDMRATADTVKLAIHYMRKAGGGSIMMTASLAGYLATKGLPMYSAAKHGVVGLMRSLKHDTAKFNIAISVVAPAITVTPILSHDGQNDPEKHVQAMREYGVPLNKPATIGLAAAYLANKGMEANGMGILCQADRMVELEGGLARTRKIWIGEQMLNYFRSGRDMGIFSKI